MAGLFYFTMDIKKHIATFLIGVIIGCGLMLALYLIEQPQNDQDLSLMDELINSWTAKVNEQFYASLRSNKEIPDARPGYIPQIVEELSLSLEINYLIPKGVTTAQWILESRWGLSNLGASNYLGHTFAAVRKYMDTPDYVMAREMVMQTGEMVPGQSIQFARYKNIRECFEVHGKYLSRSDVFRNVFEKKLSRENFARTMGRVYATDPDYGLKLIIIMRRYKIG